jgi:aldose 1-epimerase
MKKFIVFIMAAIPLIGCGNNSKSENRESMEVTGGIKEEVWGQLKDGRDASLFTLTNQAGMTVSITNFGGKIITWTAPDRNGNYENVNLRMNTLEEYFNGASFFGTIVGRFGNRIGGAKFTIDGVESKLVANDGPNSLHSSGAGVDLQLWDAEIVDAENPTLKLTTVSPDGAGGFPGNVNMEVIYTLLPDNSLKIDYTATTDKPTHVNMTNHAYFNFNSGMKQDILNHEVQIYADTYLPVDKTLIPFGDPAPVAGTPFDFTQPHTVGERIGDTSNEQLKIGRGYDHAWVFTDKSKDLKLGASVYEPTSGRVMEVYTTEPAIQFYSGNFLNGRQVGPDSVAYKFRWGFCLETEHYPDAPNKPSYPSTLLRPGETYNTTTVYKFSTR